VIGKDGCAGGDLIVVLFAVLLSAAVTD